MAQRSWSVQDAKNRFSEVVDVSATALRAAARVVERAA